MGRASDAIETLQEAEEAVQELRTTELRRRHLRVEIAGEARVLLEEIYRVADRSERPPPNSIRSRIG